MHLTWAEGPLFVELIRLRGRGGQPRSDLVLRHRAAGIPSKVPAWGRHDSVTVRDHFAGSAACTPYSNNLAEDPGQGPTLFAGSVAAAGRHPCFSRTLSSPTASAGKGRAQTSRPSLEALARRRTRPARASGPLPSPERRAVIGREFNPRSTRTPFTPEGRGPRQSRRACSWLHTGQRVRPEARRPQADRPGRAFGFATTPSSAMAGLQKLDPLF